MEDTPSRKRKRGTYRRYNQDLSIPIPRMTLWRQKKVSSTRSSAQNLNPSLINLDQPSSQSPDPGGMDMSSDSNSSLVNSSSSPSSSNADSPCSRSPSPSNSDSSCSRSPSPSNSDSSCLSQPSPSSLISTPPSPSSQGTMDFPWVDSEEETSTFTNQDQKDTFSEDLFEPLYLGSTITSCGAHSVIMHFATKNKLSYTAIEDLLKLLQLLCPQPNNLPTSLHKLKKFFKGFGGNYTKSKLCTGCSNNSSACTCGHEEKVGHLVHIDIGKAIKTLIINHWNDLEYPHSLQSDEDLLVGDIWSGSVLRSDFAPGKFFSYQEHLALSLFTDGIPLFKSSTISLWPVYLIVNNLPPLIRMYSENVILCALWCGPGKPPVHDLLKPVMSMIKDLYTIGITMHTPSGMIKTIRCKLLLGVFDLPAKAIVLNSKQFNGEYGCSSCLHPGVRLTNGARIYPPISNIEQRTNLSIINDAEKAEQSGCPENGIKGLSVLAHMMDLVNGIPVDYMHAVLEGVTRWLLRKWVDSSNCHKPFYIGRHVTGIDNALLSQHPPHEFSRRPRAIKTHVKYWKASELRSWLLFYSLPLLQGYLPPLYLHHYSLLVCALHILLQDSILPATFAAATEMIKDFAELLPELYGTESCTANAHALSHIPMFVKLWGPLWTHSAFGFESKNGHLKSLFHGKTCVTDQLVFVTDVIQTLQIVQHSLDSHESEATLEYISQVTGRAPRVNMIQRGNSVYSIGSVKPTELSSEYAVHLSLPTSAPTFQRAYINGTLYYSKAYIRGQGKRNNTVCSFKNSEGYISFGEIELFVLVPEPIAILRVYRQYQETFLEQAGNPCRPILQEYKSADLLSNYIHAVNKEPGELCAANLNCIENKAIIISIPSMSCNYVISQPNKFEFH